MADEEIRRPSSATGTAALRAGWSHGHRDVSGGWLRPTVFGAVDGLVTNASLIAGLGGGQASAHTIVLTGVAALVAGAFSMGTGEYISVTNQNELVHAEVALEKKMLALFPVAEQEELAGYFREYGADPETAARMAAAVSKDPGTALRVHTREELGVDPGELPSPLLAGVASLLAFSLGALVPLLPYLLGLPDLAATLVITAVALVTGGMVVGRLTGRPVLRSASASSLLGGMAIAVTFGIGSLIGAGTPDPARSRLPRDVCHVSWGHAHCEAFSPAPSPPGADRSSCSSAPPATWPSAWCCPRSTAWPPRACCPGSGGWSATAAATSPTRTSASTSTTC